MRFFITTSIVLALFAMGSCHRDDWPYQYPERCLSVAGEPDLVINDTIQTYDNSGTYWFADASVNGRWVVDLENKEYIVIFHRGESAFTDDELTNFSNDQWKEEFESRASISLKNGISDGRLWFFARQPDGSDLLLGDDLAEIKDGNITMKLEVLDGCEMIKVDLFCLMGNDSLNYRIDVSYRSPYFFK